MIHPQTKESAAARQTVTVIPVVHSPTVWVFATLSSHALHPVQLMTTVRLDSHVLLVVLLMFVAEARVRLLRRAQLPTMEPPEEFHRFRQWMRRLQKMDVSELLNSENSFNF